MNQGSLGVTEILCSFQLVLEEKRDTQNSPGLSVLTD